MAPAPLRGPIEDDGHETREVTVVPRAQRFEIRVPVKYRPSGATAWRDGRTENISRSGVLFRTDQPISPKTRIEFLIALPEEVGGRADAVICLGRVVRTEPPKLDDPRPAVAATIAGYRTPNSLNHTDPQTTDPRRI
ncbi:MAG: hypothetical protein DMF91_01370 [Acidobacteria bacterium]|nr:MAG: hypothetical protein DMF91_01370 [Acidobacteriota bacterium]